MPARVRAARAWDVLLALVRADIYVRYGRGPARAAKWILDPFAVVGVYLVLVALVLNKDSHAAGLVIACAVVPYQLILMTVMHAFGAALERAPIIKNMAFPRLLIPLAAVATECAAFAASLLLLAALMAVYGIAPTVAILWLPVIIAVTVVFAAGLAYPACLFGLWHRDLFPFAISFVRTLFFLAAGLVALDQITGAANDWVRVNPLTAIFEGYRDVLVEGHSPSFWELAYPVAVTAVVVAVAIPIFRRDQRDFAKVAE